MVSENWPVVVMFVIVYQFVFVYDKLVKDRGKFYFDLAGKHRKRDNNHSFIQYASSRYT